MKVFNWIMKTEVRKKILMAVSIIYLLMMFFIWNINIGAVLIRSSSLYKIGNSVLAIALFLNIDVILKEKRLKSITIFILLMLILWFNSFFVEFGGRARENILVIIRIFMLVYLVYQLNYKHMLTKGLHALLALLSIYNILGIIGAIFKFDKFFNFIPNVLTDNYRYSSVLTNPNAFGEFAFISLWIAVYFFLKYSKSILRKNIYLSLILIAVTALGVSLSRTAMLMSLVLFGVLFVYAGNYNKRIKKTLYLSLSVILATLAVLFIIKPEFMLNFLRLNQGLTGRADLWRFLIRSILNKPFVGVGFGNSSLFIAGQGLFSVSSAHNLYLGLLLEMGLLAFLILMFWAFKKMLKGFYYIQYTHKYKIELSLLSGFLLAFFIGQFFEFSFFKISSINTFVLMVLALLYSLKKEVRNEGLKKIKVVHMITGLDNGGAESMLYKILKNRNQERFEFKVISLDTKGFYGEQIENLGIKVIALDIKNIYKLPLNIGRLIALLQDVDVLQTWLYHANLIGIIFGRLTGVDKIIWGVRQSDISSEHNKESTVKIATFSKHLSFLTTHILSCSDEATKTHIELGYEESKFETIYNGFEIDRYHFDKNQYHEIRKEFGLTDETVFANVARFDIQKDHPTLFEALHILKTKHNLKNFKLVLCGMSIEKDNEALMSLINKFDLEEDVLLLGIRRDVPRILNMSDYFLLSSLGEGFPNVLGEAMLAERAVIATDVGDCKMLLGSEGLIVPKQDPEAFAAAILKFMKLPEEDREMIGKAARARIEDFFDIKRIVTYYEMLYL